MFLPFKTILEKRIRQYRFWPEILSLKTKELWQKEVERIFGKEVSQNTKPLQFRGGVLVVKVSSPVLSQELRFQEQEIKKRVNKTLRQPALKRIIYKIKS